MPKNKESQGNSGTAANLRRFLFAGLSALCLSAVALASDEPGERTFTVQGFGTAGLARTSSDDVEFVRDLSQPRGIGKDWSSKIDSVLGLQANWKLSPQVEAVVQATSRYRYDRSFDPAIEWAYVKYDPVPSVSLRAGRLGTEFFMMADSRWVGYSFLTVRPPGDYFWYLPFYTIHGADASLTRRVGEGALRAKVFYGLSEGKIPLAGEQWTIDGSPMVGGYVEYQYGPWQVRGSYSNLRFEQDLPLRPVVAAALGGYVLSTAEADFLTTKDRRAHYYSLGLVYDSGPWQSQLMLNHIEQRSQALESSDGGYALLGYRVAAVTPYVGYSWVRSQQRASGPTPVTAYIMSDSHSDQQTTFVGARWDVYRNVALKAQWDGIRGKASSLFPYRAENRARWSGAMDVWSLTLDFVF